MSAAEIANAKAEIRRLRAAARPAAAPDACGPTRAAARSTSAAPSARSLRQGGEILTIARTRRVRRPPPLVVLCDICGTMARYAQILLHFLHAVSNDRARVHVFLFGTRLSNITRQLRHRDPRSRSRWSRTSVPGLVGRHADRRRAGAFNRRWAKRVLAQGAVVLLDHRRARPRRRRADRSPENMERLHRSCRRLIWLNPLLRWSGFQAKSQGIRAMLPHVDEFRPVHNLDSLRALVQTLSQPHAARGRD